MNEQLTYLIQNLDQNEKFDVITMLAVIEKAMQNDPAHYCGQFLEDNPETAETISAFAVEMARSWFESDDTAELVMQSTLLSSVMFMTYEMVKAEVEAKELEEQWGWRLLCFWGLASNQVNLIHCSEVAAYAGFGLSPPLGGYAKKKAGRFSLIETEYH